MVGLVNQGIRDLVVARHGEAAWERIATRAGLEGPAFVTMKGYDDRLTYALVGAASEELGLPPAQLLEAFGEHWILYTAERGYGALLDLCGSTFVDFLGNLDALHGRLALSFEGLRPPALSVDGLGEGSFRLVYRSEREGLAPMVVGILRGLAKRFGVVAVVEQVRRREENGEDEFLVRYAEAAA